RGDRLAGRHQWRGSARRWHREAAEGAFACASPGDRRPALRREELPLAGRRTAVRNAVWPADRRGGMNGRRRLSICYVVPGHDLLSSVGPSRNVVNLAQALSEWADVTVA